MTIAFPTLPQTVVPQQRQPSTAVPGPQTDLENTQASAFADLLASLLTPGEEARLTPDFLPSRQGGFSED
ncbi:MAG TPA: hypothetical protein VEZ26_09560 [Sphingomonadaceae bacterium]|nr:hypothetical protein [Sphingomonadaceae bacterium]